MKRGDLVAVTVQGDDGKPRPALVVQTDFIAETDSVLVCLLTTTLRDGPLHRLNVEAGTGTGLRVASQLKVDRIIAVRRERCGLVIGRLDDATLSAAGRLLALMVGIAG